MNNLINKLTYNYYQIITFLFIVYILYLLYNNKTILYEIFGNFSK